MSAELPKPIDDIIGASQRNDMDEFMAAWAADALLSDSHRKYWGKEAIRRWCSIEWVGDDVTVTEVRNVVDHHGDHIVHAVLDGVYDKNGLPVDYLGTFLFKVRNDKIVRLIILPYGGRRLGKMTQTRMASTCFSAPLPTFSEKMTSELPRPVADCFAAINDARLDDVMKTFSEDAFVNDKHRSFHGHGAIRRWSEVEVIGERVQIEVCDAIDHYGEIVGTARIGGDFDRQRFDSFVRNSSVTVLHGAPPEVLLAFYATLHDDRIGQLVITPIDGASPIATDETPFFVPYP